MRLDRAIHVSISKTGTLQYSADSREVGHTTDEFLLGFCDLLIDFWTAFVAMNPFPNLVLGESGFHAAGDQKLTIRNVLVDFEVCVEKLFDDFRLNILALSFAQLDQSVTISSIPSLPKY